MKLSGTVAGFWFVFVVIVGVFVAFSPSVQQIDFSDRCSDGLSITVDGKFVGCVEDNIQTAVQMWSPPNGPAPMRPIKEMDDSWMDGP